MKKPFHLAWFLSQGYGPKSWRSEFPGSDVNRWMMPDIFVDLAKGMGVAAGKATNLEELTKQLTYAMSHKGPYLIDVIM